MSETNPKWEQLKKDVIEAYDAADQRMSELAPARCSTAAWPDIGNDPLKTGDFDLEAALERLRKGTGLQQKEVPDQTQLAWRIDVSRALGEIAYLRGLTKALKNTTQQSNSKLSDGGGL